MPISWTTSSFKLARAVAVADADAEAPGPDPGFIAVS